MVRGRFSQWVLARVFAFRKNRDKPGVSEIDLEPTSDLFRCEFIHCSFTWLIMV